MNKLPEKVKGQIACRKREIYTVRNTGKYSLSCTTHNVQFKTNFTSSLTNYRNAVLPAPGAMDGKQYAGNPTERNVVMNTNFAA